MIVRAYALRATRLALRRGHSPRHQHQPVAPVSGKQPSTAIRPTQPAQVAGLDFPPGGRRGALEARRMSSVHVTAVPPAPIIAIVTAPRRQVSISDSPRRRKAGHRRAIVSAVVEKRTSTHRLGTLAARGPAPPLRAEPRERRRQLTHSARAKTQRRSARTREPRRRRSLALCRCRRSDVYVILHLFR